MTVIIYLVSTLRILTTKKEKAEEIIKELKIEEKVLENEIEAKDHEIQNLETKKK
ncbi:MAG: hypothetical protein QY322_04145 [bacterium]|nr:MAG: hypothetical protein QY322_04145 [bacterium]